MWRRTCDGGEEDGNESEEEVAARHDGDGVSRADAAVVDVCLVIVIGCLQIKSVKWL